MECSVCRTLFLFLFLHLLLVLALPYLHQDIGLQGEELPEMVCKKSSFREAGEGVETVWFGGGESKRGMMLSSMTRFGMAWERKLKLIRGETGDTASSICMLNSKALVLGCSSCHGGRREEDWEA